MPAVIAALRVGLTWLGRIGLAAFAVNEVKNLTTGQQKSITQGTEQALASGVSETDHAKLIAATTYDQVEQDGKDPDDFWSGLNKQEKELLQFSPETLRQDMGRTKFLGITSALMFVAALFAGGVAGIRGIPILVSTLAKIAKARKAGTTALGLMTILEEGKIAGLARVWVPGFIAGIASAGGWLTSGMTNNMNDATLWGRIFLGQAADDFESAKANIAKEKAKSSADSETLPTSKTIIKIVEEKKPEQFIGTLFSAKLGPLEDFTRHVDDEITSEADLMADVKINLNKWLASLPGRLGYSVIIRKDPVDHTGVKQSGNWVTLTTHMTRLSGPIQPIDTILIGPVSPVTRLKLSKVIKTIEQQIPKILTGQEITQIEVPNGTVDIFGADGERVDLGTPTVKKTTTPTPTTAPTLEVAVKPNAIFETRVPTLKTPEELLALQKANPLAEIESFVNLGSTFVPRDGYEGIIFKVSGGKLYSYDPVMDLMSDDERRNAGNYGAQVRQSVNLLRAKGVDVSKINKAAFIADIVGKYRDNRENIETFREFFNR